MMGDVEARVAAAAAGGQVSVCACGFAGLMTMAYLSYYICWVFVFA